jgi:hypothetical protein
MDLEGGIGEVRSLVAFGTNKGISPPRVHG